MTATLSHDKELVTADLDHFRRIPSFELVTYRSIGLPHEMELI